MIFRDLLKKNSYLLLILLIFSCTSGTRKTSEQDKIKMDFKLPEIVQQEFDTSNSSFIEEYSFYNSNIKQGPIIPGIFQGSVPQGMAYYSDKDLMLISNYMFDSRPSCITSIKMSNGILEKILWLLNPDGSPHKGHVGGLAVSDNYLWIASGKGVYYVSLENLINQADNSNLKMETFVPTVVKGSFSTFADGILWVGEFTSKDGTYSVPKDHHYKTMYGTVNHGLLAGFILDSVSDMINHDHNINNISYPDYILSIPDEVQGAAFINGEIILSQSYGRKNNSRISVYIDPGGEFNSGIFNTDDGRSIPVWILSKDNLKIEIAAPPMTEGIVDYKGALAVLYESGSDKYRGTAKNPQGRIHILSQIP